MNTQQQHGGSMYQAGSGYGMQGQSRDGVSAGYGFHSQKVGDKVPSLRNGVESYDRTIVRPTTNVTGSNATESCYPHSSCSWPPRPPRSRLACLQSYVAPWRSKYGELRRASQPRRRAGGLVASCFSVAVCALLSVRGEVLSGGT